MSKIHISRDRRVLGHFFPGEVAAGLRSGRFLPTDLAWQDPMESWKPLGEFTDLPVIEDEPAGVPPLPVEGPVPAPLTHPGEPAWEQAAALGTGTAFFRTIGQVFSQPLATFGGLNREAPVGRAIGFYVVLSTVSTWVFLAYQLVFILMMPAMVKEQFGDKVTTSMLIAGSVFNMLFAPLFLAGMAFVFTGILHLLLTLFGLAAPSFAVTLRVFCYAVGASFLLLLVPMCGLLLFLPCAVIYLSLGLKQAHEVDPVRPLIAVLIPVLILCAGYFLLLLQAGLLK